MILKKCKINEFIIVKLEEVDYDFEDRTYIYVDEKCIYYIDLSTYTYEKLCKDLHKWYSSNYDCSLLSPDLAFRLLKVLIESEDPLAIKVGDQEILRGLRKGKIDQSYRNLLKHKTFWESSEFDTKPLEDLESLIQKEIVRLKSITARNIWEPCVGFVVKEKKVTALLLEDCGLEEFPEQITQLEHLEYLLLSDNRIKSLPDSIKNLKNLVRLRLRNNKFQKFPYVLLNMISLKNLDLWGNEISEIPNNIISLKNLQLLSYKEKSKVFPEVLCHMKHIIHLSVQSPIEILPPSYEFLYKGINRSIFQFKLRSSASHTTRKAWQQYFEHNKKLCTKCQKAYHTDNFPMCYDCLIKYESRFRDDPLDYTKDLKYFNYKEWLNSSEPEKIYQEKINESIKNNGIFSYPKKVQSLVKRLKKQRGDFKNFKDPKFLPLFRKAIFDTEDKYLLVAYGERSYPPYVEEELRKLFNKSLKYNNWEGTFFLYLEAMESKVARNFLPEINNSLQKWVKKYALKLNLKASIPSLEGTLHLHQYGAKYGTVDNFIVVSCTFTNLLGPIRELASIHPNKLVSQEIVLKELHGYYDEYTNGILPVTYIKNLVFISDIDLDEDISESNKQQHIKQEINDLIELFSNLDYLDIFKFMSLDDLPDLSFIRIILFEEQYQKEYLYSIIYRFSGVYDYKKNIDEETLEQINKVVPSEVQEKLAEELEKKDLRFK